jgi:hypothetical protein
LTLPYPQHPVAGVVVGPLELVFYGNDLNLEGGPRQVLADGAGCVGPFQDNHEEIENEII